MTQRERMQQAAAMMTVTIYRSPEWSEWYKRWAVAFTAIAAAKPARYDSQVTCDCGRHVRGCKCQQRANQGVANVGQ